MKIRTFVTLAFATVLVGTLAISAAAADWTMTADIPFAFQVGSTQMPAGLYTFGRYNSNTTFWIRSADGKVSIWAFGSPLDSSNPAASPRVVFNRYGDRYFIGRIVLAGGYSTRLPKSNAEAEYQANGGGGSSPVEIFAIR